MVGTPVFISDHHELAFLFLTRDGGVAGELRRALAAYEGCYTAGKESPIQLDTPV